MDKDTLVESLQYRCLMRGEDYEAFAREYVSRDDLKEGHARGGDEARIADALLKLLDALDDIDAVVQSLMPTALTR